MNPNGIKQQYSSHDFVAFQLMAGNPLTPASLRLLGTASKHVAARLAWIANCNAFCTEYFEPRYPNGRWVDFMRDYNTWIEFHRIVRQENNDDEQKSASPVRSNRAGGKGTYR